MQHYLSWQSAATYLAKNTHSTTPTWLTSRFHCFTTPFWLTSHKSTSPLPSLASRVPPPRFDVRWGLFPNSDAITGNSMHAPGMRRIASGLPLVAATCCPLLLEAQIVASRRLLDRRMRTAYLRPPLSWMRRSYPPPSSDRTSAVEPCTGIQGPQRCLLLPAARACLRCRGRGLI